MKDEVIAYTDPKSPVSEMFKTLRTNIQFMNSNKPLKTLLVTSTLPGEGKSWTAANLAVTFAQAGKKVLIIDADMRKGRQFNIFDVPPTPGLSNYLSGVIDGESGKFELDRFIKETEVENLHIIPAGNVPPNPTELLVSEKMLDLIKKVKEIFDITIFDGTPGLLVADASILSRIVDSSIIVTAHNETKIDNVSEVKKAIENIGGKVAGVVINKIPQSAKKYENTYYYGHTTAPAVIKEKKTKKLFHVFDHHKDKIEEFKDETDKLIAKQHELIEKHNKEQEEKEEKEDAVEEQVQEPEQVQVQEQTKEQEDNTQDVIEEEKQETETIQEHVQEQPQEQEQAQEQTQKPVIEQHEEEPKVIEITEDQQVEEPIANDDILNEINNYIEENKADSAFGFIPTDEKIGNNTVSTTNYIPFEANEIEEEVVENSFEEISGPKLSWEQEAESAYEKIKQQNEIIKESESNSNDTLIKTQDILNQINEYLAEERRKFKNGGLDD